MDPVTTLQQLRREPVDVIKSAKFVVARSDYDIKGIGGRCRVSCESLGGCFYRLMPTNGSGDDYYFPYVSAATDHGNGEGIGLCTVPADAPKGTLVLTGAMNGCALEVRKSGDMLTFVHDANGKSLQRLSSGGPLQAAQRLRRISADDYWDHEIAGATGDAYKAIYNQSATAMHFSYRSKPRVDGRSSIVPC